MTFILLALLACDPTSDTGDTGAVVVDTSWGVVDACTATRDGGFGDFYDTDHVVLVHGSTDAWLESL